MPELVFKEASGGHVDKGYHFFFLFTKSISEKA